MTTKPDNQTTSFKKSSPWLGILPFIGIILFLGSFIPMAINGFSDNWQTEVLQNAIVYMIGWAGIGAGISHIFFGDKISKSIGFKRDPYEFEVGFAGLSFGIAALLAPNFSTEYWFAVILMSSIYRIGCGIGHVIQIVKAKNYAVNNTAILLVDFGAPIFLLLAYAFWS